MNKKLTGAALGVALIFTIACKKNIQQETKLAPEEVSVSPVKDPPEYLDSIVKDSASNSLFFFGDDAVKRQITRKKGWQGAPAIGIENNRLYAAWYIGEHGEEMGNYVTVATSDDMGKTWTENAMIIAPNPETNRQIDPQFWKDKNGELHLSWTMVVGGWDGATGGVWHIKLKTVKGKIKITKPIRLFNGVMNVKPTPLKADSSVMLFPASGWNIGNTYNGLPAIATSPDQNGPFLYTATYLNKKLTTPNYLAKIPVVTSKRNVDEHMVVTLDDNNFICMMRQLDGLYVSNSSDGGSTWDQEPKKFTALGSTAASRFYFGRLKSGNLLFIFNNATWRTNLTAFLSTDNGKTWGQKLVIDNDQVNVSEYPDIIQNQEGDILLVYDRDRTGLGHIVFTSFKESDIKSTNPTPTKILISKFK